MKKWIALLLASAMAVSLSACGGGNAASETAGTPSETQAQTERAAAIASQTEDSAAADTEYLSSSDIQTEESQSKIWDIQQTVDEFGDITKDSMRVLSAEISGDFSNTATASSNLAGFIRFVKDPNSDHYNAQFALLEYGATPVTYLDSDEKTLKVKIDDNIFECALTGKSPNDSLFAGAENYDYSGDWLFNTLYSGSDLRCIVYIGSSQYNFTVECGNFTELCDSEGFTTAPAGMTAKEAVEIYVTENEQYMPSAVDYFTANIDKIPILATAEMSNLLVGNFLEITIDTFAPYWNIESYKENMDISLADMTYESYGRSFHATGYSTGPEISYENDLLTRAYSNAQSQIFQCRKLSDNIIVFYEADDTGAYVVPYKLAIRYDEPVSVRADIYDTMIPYIQNTLIPEIKY